MIRLLVLTLMCLCAAPGAAHEYGTLELVQWVEACIARFPGVGRYEMQSKCSCAIDAIASEVDREQFTEIYTAANAISIAGERGATLRDSEFGRAAATRYRDLEKRAFRKCFIVR